MKEHFCPAEKTTIAYRGKCNWCGEQETLAQTQEPVAYDKTEMNCFVQDLYDKKMQEGKHGHYETMFHVVHQAIKKVPPQRTWVGLTDEDICMFSMWLDDKSDVALFTAIEAKLKELNT
jgi:hypothetical protein